MNKKFMKRSLAVLPFAAASLVGFAGSAEAVSFFTIGDELNGASTPNGVITLGNDGPGGNTFGNTYFGTTEVAPNSGPLIQFNSATNGLFSVAPISAAEGGPAGADTFNAGAPPTQATGGFAEFLGTTSSLRSFSFGPVSTIVSNFFVSQVGVDRVEVDIDVSTIEPPAGDGLSGPNYSIVPGVGGSFTVQFRNAPVRRYVSGVLTDTAIGTFELTSQDLLTDTFETNTGNIDNGLAQFILPAQSYSWNLEVTADVPVPEASNVVGLLALGIIGGGVILKRQVRR